ncbi:clathrin assembly protein-like [Dorcoceras hygrometricum]|nr:clathrin assembly protein-like [Dorcoceras hygrometricum]
MKVEFRLLNDILAKTVTAKAGSFDAVTHKRFLIMTAILGRIKINWRKFLFEILKEMVTPSSKQARGFAVATQGSPRSDSGESKPFPPLKVLTVKIFGTYIAKNKYLLTYSEEVKEKTVVEKVVKAAVKRRPAPAAEPVAKKKRTTVGRPTPKEKDLSIVSVGSGLVQATLTSIDPASKGKEPLVEEIRGNPAKEIFSLTSADVDFLVQIRDAIIEEIVYFFHPFSIRSLSTLKSVLDLAGKEEQILRDGLRLIRYTQLIRDTDLDTETVPTGIFDPFQHVHSAEGFVDFFVQLISDSSPSSSPSSSSLTSSRSTFSSESPIQFSEDLPQIEMPTVAFPSTDFTESTAQL